MAIRLELTVDDKGSVKLTQFTSNVNAQLDKVEKKSHSVGNAFVSNFSSMTKSVLAFAGIAGIGSFIKSSIESAERLVDLSRATNTTVEELSTLNYWARQNGADIGTVTTSFRAFTEQVSAARQGVFDADLKFKNLNVSLLNSDGTARRLYDVYLDTVDALSKVRDETLRLDLSQDFLGRGAIELGAAIAGGRKEFDEFAQKGREANAIMSTQSSQNAEKFSQAIENFTTQLQTLVIDGLSPLLPQLTQLINDIGPGVKAAAEIGAAALQGMRDAVREIMKDAPEISTNISTGTEVAIRRAAKLRKELMEERGIAPPLPIRPELPDMTGFVAQITEFKEKAKTDDDFLGIRGSIEPAAQLKTTIEGTIPSIGAMRDTFADVGLETDELYQRAQDITQNIAGAMTSAILNINEKTKVFKSIVSSIGRAILQEIVTALVQAIAKAVILRAVMGALGFLGFSQGGVVGGFARGGIVGYPSGGVISGGVPIRTHTGDNRLIAAQTGEGILTREATARVGGATGVRAINEGRGVGGNTYNLTMNFTKADERWMRREFLPLWNKLITTTPLEAVSSRVR